MRTIVDIPDTQVKFLKQLSEKKKMSRAEIIRRALNNYITEHNKTVTGYKSAFGSWGESNLKDGVSYQQKLRDEWER